MKNENSDGKKHYLYWIVISIISTLLLILNYFYFQEKISSNGELITHYVKKDDPMDKFRNPAVAGLFYSSHPQDLSRDVESYLQTSPIVFNKQPKILVVPHAGYQYSAPAAAKAYRQLQQYASKIKNVIILGPSHHVAFKGAALPKSAYFVTPLGKVKVNREWCKMLYSRPGIVVNEKAHQKEHSIEVQLPFLQKVLDEFEIIPMAYSDINPQSLAETLAPFLRREDTLLVVSADLSHYYSYEQAKVLDSFTAELINAQIPNLKDHQSCGANGINTALILSQIYNLKPQILTLINSGDTAGTKDEVVGYGAWSFAYNSQIENEEIALKSFAEISEKDLLKIARISLQEAVNYQRKFIPSRKDYNNQLFDKGATFVTLKQNGKLRGCVGSLLPRQAVALDVAENTFKAALEDNRFEPLTAEELEKTDITIALLTGFEKIDYESEQDLLRQLVPEEDGIIIRDGDRQALFLPAVWEELPDKVTFLHQLKLKAGMSPSYWTNSIKVYRFKTMEMKENGN